MIIDLDNDRNVKLTVKFSGQLFDVYVKQAVLTKIGGYWPESAKIEIFSTGSLSENQKMPFKSQAQARLLFATKPKIAKEFASKTKSIKKLPEHVKPKSKRK